MKKMPLTDAQRRERAVKLLAAQLLVHFDVRHHLFLVDYGWEDVARFVLKKLRRQLKSYGDKHR